VWHFTQCDAAQEQTAPNKKYGVRDAKSTWVNMLQESCEHRDNAVLFLLFCYGSGW
jgi:hypothetical protein